MIKSLLKKYGWILNPGEWLLLAYFFIFEMMSLAAVFEMLPQAGTTFLWSTGYFLIWIMWLVWMIHKNPNPTRTWGVIRNAGLWMGIALCYNLMKYLVPTIHPGKDDQDLFNIERAVWGCGPALWGHELSQHINLTDFFCFFYLSLFIWLIGLVIYHLWIRRALYQRFMLGLILVYGGGFLGYLICPAVGPRFAFAQQWAWLQGGWLFTWTNWIVQWFGSKIDVFPSLHGAISSYLLFWQSQNDRRGLLWGIPLTLGIWCSTLYLGYHYLPDLASGVCLAMISLWLVPFLEYIIDAYQPKTRASHYWLIRVTKNQGAYFGKLMSRLSQIIELGGETAPGFVFLGVSKSQSESEVKKSLKNLGGPFWIRRSDFLTAGQQSLRSLKPYSEAQVLRVLFESRLSLKRNFYIVQKALKVSAVGLCRTFPQKGLKLSDVEIRITLLSNGNMQTIRVPSNNRFLSTYFNWPWAFFQSQLETVGFELFDLVQLTRKLSNQWNIFTEVEWCFSQGRFFVLDGRGIRQ